MINDLQIVQTLDGSHTIFHPGVNQHYHSHFGALGESMHIFIHSGLKTIVNAETDSPVGQTIRILEVGFGTGLNAFLTLAQCKESGVKVNYDAIEPHPLPENCWSALNYPHRSGNPDLESAFRLIHKSPWEEPVNINPGFTLRKICIRLEDFIPATNEYHLVYFDAFDPVAQPDLWTEDIFRKIAAAQVAGGILVTYSVKGTVVRALKKVGYITQKLQGPPGKRHILRAIRY